MLTGYSKDYNSRYEIVNRFLSNEKITSGRIKDSFFYIYRFQKGMFVASEVPWHNISDIVLANKDFTEFTDIEIKISKYDFLNDFKKLKYQENELNIEQPFHKFYFCVPTYLKDFVLDYLVTNKIEAGLIECTNESFDYRHAPFIHNLKIVKKANSLKTESLHCKEKLSYTFILRMTSELSNEKMKKYDSDFYRNILEGENSGQTNV